MNPRHKSLLKILKILQSDFPLVKNPYQKLAKRLGMTETSLIAKIKTFKKQGVIRRVGAVLSSHNLGYKSVLIALEVPKARINSIARFVNAYPNVTHNYQRNSKYNIWFAFCAQNKREIDSFIKELKRKKGINKVLVLPAEKRFKINAEFNF